ncbi:hypothetical protein MLD38_000495 [Melastoma candidum]|uniref:Uncharacterized protein n=1 Tax=Melastoma candidum TaxID=119954 RepID=A0ACB9SA81_9MYRT|nr:hypothetical protein MLD38_000495 [Melastoma candidum]
MAAPVSLGAVKVGYPASLGRIAVGRLRRRFCNLGSSTPSGWTSMAEVPDVARAGGLSCQGNRSYPFDDSLGVARRSAGRELISSGGGILVGRKSKATPLMAAAGGVVSGVVAEASAPRCIVLDIEGTTTPISFVFDVLFPYARDNVGRHLSATFETPETRDDIELLRSQVEVDLGNGVPGAVQIPSNEAGKEEVIAALVTNVEAMIKADRKITSLKQLQGHIWRTGFFSDEIEAIVFEDVPKALQKWHSSGIKVYIYSSGSRLAQRLIFGNTNYGDLRKYLSGFFDTIVGNKRETRSYVEISEFLGVDKPSDILFVTDVYQEATAAKSAGLEVVISIRPGNGPLPEDHGFKTVSSFLEI